MTNLLERRWLLGVPVVGLAMMFSLALAEGADLLPAPTPPAAPPAPPAPAVMAFSRPFNCYAGIVGEVSISHPDFANTLAVNSYSESYALGRRGGGVAGCDFLFRSGAFIGADLTATFGRLNGDQHGFKFSMPVETSARIRLGYMLDPDVAVYFAVGPALASLNTADPAGVTTKGTVTGVQYGPGYEYRFAPAWRFRGEYAFSYYGSRPVSITGNPLARMNPTEHLIRMAIMRVF